MAMLRLSGSSIEPGARANVAQGEEKVSVSWAVGDGWGRREGGPEDVGKGARALVLA